MKKVILYDTTLRDGTQAEGVSLSAHEKVRIAKQLDAFGIHYIEGGWPGSNPKDMAFFEAIRKEELNHATVAAFGSTKRANIKVEDDANIKAIVDAKVKTATIFGKSWDLHVTEVFKVSLKENLTMIYESVDYLKSKKMEVFFDAEHFFDGYKANPEYALKALSEAVRGGADAVVLCDTNGGSTPNDIWTIMETVKKEVPVQLGIHCHNDMGMAVANSVIAVDQGCTQVQGTINGFGERCGNANLVSIIPILTFKYKKQTVPKSKLKNLQKLSRFVAEVCNLPLQNSQPFVGVSAFAHKGGVHVNAMLKNKTTYEILDPALVGNHRRFLVSELSGATNILIKAKELEFDLDKNTPETRQILMKIQDLENEGYQFEAAEASLELLMKKVMGKHKSFFDLVSFRVIDEKREDNKMVSEATITLKVNGVEEHTAADGDGPVNALDGALRKALTKFYPILEQIHLIDYSVRVINGKEGTAAKVRVFVQFQDEKYAWTTVGVSENIIEASWQAIVDAIEYRLMKG
ncbi:MAG: citramalate synthase [Candidatus Omnitrophica bacterium]|nr:citramalate synthase [Candidatus Omnitrophota bacterium]